VNLRTLTTRVVLAAALFAAAAGTAAQGSAAAPAEEYVPFVTDFPKPAEKYVPFVSDFPKPATPAPAVAAEPSGIDWSGIGDEGSLAASLALLAGAGLFLARRRHLRLPFASLLALIAVAATAGFAEARPSEPDVPAAIAVPEGHKPFLVGHAVGVQIYACGAAGWTFVAPRANLYDKRGKLLTTHFAGPTWQAKDGSFVVGRVVDRAPADGTIPWLLLEAASTSGERLGQTSFVQRLATTGGLAPAAAGCNADTAGAIAEVPYTADYVFWKRKGH
jgi:hypothetical protein